MKLLRIHLSFSRHLTPPFRNYRGVRRLGATSVAAFLYDLTDPANETHDAVSYPGSYVRDIVKTCQGRFFGIWKRAYSVQHLIYCFEQNFDANVASTYFPNVTNPTDYQ